MDALDVLCTQLTRDLFAIAKFIVLSGKAFVSINVLQRQTRLVHSNRMNNRLRVRKRLRCLTQPGHPSVGRRSE